MNKSHNRIPGLKGLIALEAVVRLGSVTAAASELGLTQAAVSKQVHALERELDAPLFTRRNRMVVPTEAASAFAKTLARSLGDIAAAADRLRRVDLGPEVVIRTQLFEGLFWLTPRLTGLYRRHPDIAVRVTSTLEPLSEAREHYDLALQSAGRPAGTAEEIFGAVDWVQPVCAPAYLAGRGEVPSLDALDRERLLHHRVDPQEWIDWDAWLAGVGRAGLTVPAGRDFDSYPIAIQAAIEGQGIALGWRRTIARHLATGTLVPAFDPALHMTDRLSVFRPFGGSRGGRQHPDTGRVLEWLKEALRADPIEA
ncbi:LysR family transcriptional regulator [Marivibrio halodurans]|uniref:LysR family transcriptional regulator n=1 Tax=Marivibrio halodurans TaxID=2039722 RepID=A0A8J7RYP9_9PROT|nr:LysR family transcriptional regulator [Marivibrio halodurans]MBP5855553.1 LysR family transcriptional regulator [Marivibrio halodurans]